MVFVSIREQIFHLGVNIFENQVSGACGYNVHVGISQTHLYKLMTLNLSTRSNFYASDTSLLCVH